jgi:SAM-dependent methyltransferase
MLSKLKKIDRSFFINPSKIINVLLARMGNGKQCYVCKKEFHSFLKFDIYHNESQKCFERYHIIGSSGENYGCTFCHSNDRLRHLFMYFDATGFWEKIPNSRILHFAPEDNLVTAIKKYNPTEHILADFYPVNDTIRKIDITSIPFDSSTFDIVICNHVLEHIVDYKKALTELYRVLKPGGIAILQTPYSTVLAENFEDENINTEALRLSFYAQEDHVRIFGEKQFLNELVKTGFELHTVKHSDYFRSAETTRYGVNEKEDLIRVIKPLS